MMTKKYKILGNFVKDMSSETPNIETYLYAKEYITKYQLNIDINSKALKNKMVEINTVVKFEDKSESLKKAYFEIVYITIVKLDDQIQDKKELEKIILCDVQIDIYPKIQKALLDLLHNSGYPEVKFEKKVNFEDLYNQRLS